MALTDQQIRELPPMVDFLTAAKCFDIQRDSAYYLAKHGGFPVEVVEIGRRKKVRRADLIRALGIAA